MAIKFAILATLILSICLEDVDAKIFDLSHTHKSSTFVFPGNPRYNHTILFKGDWSPGVLVITGHISTTEHSGTHIDVPAHFYEGAKTLPEITVDMAIADGVMVDCSAEVAQDPTYELTLQKLLEWERKYGRIPNEAAILVNFDWSRRFEDHEAYMGSDSAYLFPFIGEEASRWLEEERNAKIIGVDTLSSDPLDPSLGRFGYIHQRFLPKNKLLVENLKDVGHLPPRGFRFFAVPVKYEGGTGTQVRAFAVTYDEDVFFADASIVQPGVVLLIALVVGTLITN